jgi:glutathione S-transferase
MPFLVRASTGVPIVASSRMMADVFDDYIHVQTQRIVGDALRKKEERDPRGVADAHALMDRCYAWLEPRLRGKEWAACGRFTIADCAAAPALFYGDWVHPITDCLPALAAYRARLLKALIVCADAIRQPLPMMRLRLADQGSRKKLPRLG